MRFLMAGSAKQATALKAAGGSHALPVIVMAKPPAKDRAVIENVALTHPDRQLWPGISKRDLAIRVSRTRKGRNRMCGPDRR